MFYSQFILAKKGPLGTIWIAAHLERKLRKNQVADTDIGVSVDSILFPDVPIALRLSSHLLLGVVRIYSKKVNYLFDDCSEALLKVKQAFRSTAVDLPPEESKAPYHSITLPETFDLDDFELPDDEIFQGNYVDHHVSTREQITLQDTMDGVVYSASQFGLDERFGDGDTSQAGLDLDEEVFHHKDVATAEDVGVSGADLDVCLDASTPEIKESIPETDEAMLQNLNEDQVEDLIVHNELHEYAQAPQTPGLVEVPNLSSAREEPAYDDHMEVEDQNASDVAEEGRKAIRKLDVCQMHSCTDELSSEHDIGQKSDVNMLPDETSDPDRQIVRQGESTVAVTVGDKSQIDGKANGQNEPVMAEHVRAESPCCSHITTEMEDPGQVMTVPGASKDDGMIEKSEAVEHQSSQDPTDLGVETRGECGIAAEANQETDFSLRGDAQADSSRPDGQLENVHTADTQLGNVIGSADSDLPAPEKVLSVPDGLADKEDDFMIETTPDKEDADTTNKDHGTKNITGRKRTFTESTLTAESLNSVESVGLIHSRRTADSVPDDDDLLSSILVGRSSFLKMKSTPVLEVASSNKRLRSAPRSASKRKVLMDDPMVLHGDVIRQQLTNTEDIRRVRKKAPCTHAEILMLHRQFLEDELFKEPIFTGLSVELVSLHNEPYDLRGIRVIGNNDPHASTGVMKDDECSVRSDVVEEDRVKESSVPTVSRNDSVEQPAQGHMYEQDQQNKDLQGETKVDNELVGDKPEVEVDGEGNGDADEVNISASHGTYEMETGKKIYSAEDLQGDGSRENHEELLDGQVAEDVFPLDTSNKSCANPIELAEGNVENMVMSEMDLKAEDELLQDETKMDVSPGLSEIEKEGPVLCDDAIDCLETGFIEAGGSGNPAMENGSDAVGVGNIDGVQTAEIESDNKDPAVSNDVSNEEADVQNAAGLGAASRDGLTGDNAQEMETTGFEHDTGFLNVDDDDEGGENDDEDGTQYVDETRVLENSGWSSRTRAVAKYLQTLFDKEAECGKNVLLVDNLLTGKTRKEASRMFFETLVLKTKDYIQVEQAKPFDSIKVKPRAKLMKSIF
ncbi:PREDICTED: sister chromatid cohesion 1 protein 4 [Tarenaya hassleriana]|uniref:sister chromatid cohesion 1 protein 4 n=1 Tax=Tarenaya hassleriana TaxID=28532 RepID=UPI00053C22CC|nr:PREDICTED: sister chromatid cohesion 1 protein 4 [Tarenaya hassleriana]XP_010549895.1 PREDICTED: sister chromatid cohesion 1 protein 4 [Tarenaya hassleriana]